MDFSESASSGIDLNRTVRQSIALPRPGVTARLERASCRLDGLGSSEQVVDVFDGLPPDDVGGYTDIESLDPGAPAGSPGTVLLT
jgi:hypothetical protein